MSVYEYTKLAHLSSSSSATKINCFGIVTSIEKETKISNPKTNQDQWQMVVQLVDESCSDGQSITCSLCAEKQTALPCIKRLGDILRLHRVPRMAQGFLGGRIGVGGFHAVVWDSEHGGSLKPRGATSTTFSNNKDEQQRLNELRLWWLQQNASMRPAKERLSSLSPYQYGDIICQVIGVIVSRRESTFVRVWDGTRISFNVFSLSDDEIMVDLSTVDENLAKLAAGFSQDIICYGDLAVEARCLTPGDIVCVTNLHVYKKPPSSVAQLTMHSRNTNHTRCFKTLSKDDAQAQQLLRDLQMIGGHPTLVDGASSTSTEAEASVKQHDRQVVDGQPSQVDDGATASTSTAADASSKTRRNCETQPACSTSHKNADSQVDEDDEDEEEVMYSQAPFAIVRREKFDLLPAIEESEEPNSLLSQSPPPANIAAESAGGTSNDDAIATDDRNLVDNATTTRKRKSDSDELFPNPLAEKEPRPEEETAIGDGSHSVDRPRLYHRRVTCDQLIVNLLDWKDGDFISIIDEFRLNDCVWDSLFPSRAHGQSDHLFYVQCNRCGHCWRLAESGLEPGQHCPLCSKENVCSSSMLRLTVELVFIRTIGKQSAAFLCREPLVKQLIPSFSSAEALFAAFNTQDKQLVKLFWKEAEGLCKQRFSVSSAQVITVCSMRQFLVHKANIAV